MILQLRVLNIAADATLVVLWSSLFTWSSFVHFNSPSLFSGLVNLVRKLSSVLDVVLVPWKYAPL